jgi:uncharacterized membrane protein YeaQ/YmgE (transglycosylase-associated protein family)
MRQTADKIRVGRVCWEKSQKKFMNNVQTGLMVVYKLCAEQATRNDGGTAMLLNLVLWAIFGAIAGWIASKIVGGDNTLGVNIILGIIGAVVGGFVAGLLGIDYNAGFSIGSLLVAVGGAIIVILIVRALRRAG